MSKADRRTNPNRYRAMSVRANQRRRDRVKAEGIEHYGGACAICGIDDPDVLTIDHIYDDGEKERRENRSSRDIWEHLVREGYPPGKYQLLCANCNLKKMVKRRRAKSNARVEEIIQNTGPS